MPAARLRNAGNVRLGRGLRRRQKNATEAGARCFEKAAPDARSATPRGSRVAHQLEDDCGSAIDRAILSGRAAEA